MLELLSECTGVLFILTLSTAALSHRKPASPEILRDACCVQGHDKRAPFCRRVRKIAKSDY